MAPQIDSTELAGKVALVTGAGQGMGRAVAARLAAGGARVVVNDLRPEAAERTAQALADAGHEATPVAGDVSNADEVREMFGAVAERYGALHVLVNNAGVLYPTAVEEMSVEEWDLVVAVNLTGTFLCSQAAAPQPAAPAFQPMLQRALAQDARARGVRRGRALTAT